MVGGRGGGGGGGCCDDDDDDKGGGGCDGGGGGCNGGGGGGGNNVIVSIEDNCIIFEEGRTGDECATITGFGWMVVLEDEEFAVGAAKFIDDVA